MKLYPHQNYTDSFSYIDSGIEAEGHTPIYKMHKYFARRPHNVFRHLIEFYTEPDDVVLDCFCGGGVTLFEGLSTSRKIIAVDVNPLATFVADCQTTLTSIDEYKTVLQEIWEDFRKLTQQHYFTHCRRCNLQANVRWFELAYTVVCPYCSTQTLLGNNEKLKTNGKIYPGHYVCMHCEKSFAAINSKRTGSELLSVVYRCSCMSERQVAIPSLEDKALKSYFEEAFSILISDYDLWYPSDEIPLNWDRQYEDGLYRKSVVHFTDLFTHRSLFFNAYLLKQFQSYKGKVSSELYKMLIFTFSAVLRYTNNMSYSTGNWMDGRPVAWDKHAYWTPNQFVEVNPIEYLEKRRDAIVSGLKYQQNQLKKVKKVDNFKDLVNFGTHIVWCKSSNQLNLPDESIDAIITDPPYGSNVQYGELSHYWLVWLRDELNLDDKLFTLEEEILVNRKTNKDNAKKYQDYFEGLYSVFTECYRVLKNGKVLVFTFNNKDLKAWYAVIKAAVKAGFFLAPEGIVYQEPIENYKNTAHTRYSGALHGDFIYTFRKLAFTQFPPIEQEPVDTSIKQKTLDVIKEHLLLVKEATLNELHIKVLTSLIPYMVDIARTDNDFEQLNHSLDFDSLESLVQTHLRCNPVSGLWMISE